MRKNTSLLMVLLFSVSLFSQTKEDTKTLKKELSNIKTEISKLEKKANAIQAKIDKQYGWKITSFGTIGINLSHFDNWYSNSEPNVSAGNIRIVNDVYAKLEKEKYFWLSYINLNLSWAKSYNQNKDTENKGFENQTDIYKIASLFGYKLSENFAVSTLVDYRGTLIQKFADPSFVDVGVGVSWKPVENFYIVVNPINYNFIFSSIAKEYQSSMGTKLLADYTHKLRKLNINSNLTAFVSYKSSNLSNWTWKNSLSYSFWKGIGLGFNFGLQQNKQEQFNSNTTLYPTLKDTDSKLQSFWMFGLSYAL